MSAMMLMPTRREQQQLDKLNPVAKSLDEIQRLMHRKTTVVEESFAQRQPEISTIRIVYLEDVFEINIEDCDERIVTELSNQISELLMIENDEQYKLAMQFSGMSKDVSEMVDSIREQIKKDAPEPIPVVIQEQEQTENPQPSSKGENMSEENTQPQPQTNAVEQFLSMAKHCKTVENLNAVYHTYARAFPAAIPELQQEKLKLQTYMIQKGYIQSSDQNSEKEKLKVWQIGALVVSVAGAGLLIWKSLGK